MVNGERHLILFPHNIGLMTIVREMHGNTFGLCLKTQHAANLEVKRVCWEVLDWNADAIDFYKAKGADVKRDWDVVHLDERGIKNYLSKLDSCKS